MFKRGLSILLSLMILVTSFPAGAMAEDVTQNMPLYNGMESKDGIAVSGGTASLTQDRKVGKYAVRISGGNVVSDYISYKLGYSAMPFDLNQYSQLKVWIKPAQGAKWVKFWAKNETEMSEAVIKSDKDSDGMYKVGQDLVSGKWNLVTLDLSNRSNLNIGKMTTLWAQTNDLSSWFIDEVTSVYAPTLSVDISSMVNSQTHQPLNGGLQFKSSGTGTYNTSPTVLISGNGDGPEASFITPAYKDDGTPVSNNIPRYERGYFHNLLIDNQASFENGLTGIQGYNSNLAIDGSNKYLGNSSLKVTVNSSDNGVFFSPSSSGLKTGMSVKPNTTYSLSAYVKFPQNIVGKNARIWLKQNDGDFGASKWHRVNDTEWTRISTTITSSQVHLKGSVWISVDGGVPLGTTYGVDCVQIEEGAVAKSWVLPSQGKGVLVEEGTVNLLSASQSSFEDGVNNWTNTGTASIETTVAWSGNKSLKFTIPNGGDPYTYASFGNGTSIAGKTYTFSTWIKQENVGPGGVILRTYWMDNLGNWIWQNNVATGYLDGTRDWYRLSATAIAPSGAVKAALLIQPYTKNGVGAFWIDGAQIEEKPYATSWTLGGSSRIGEVLSIPTTNKISAKEGTIDFTWIPQQSIASIKDQTSSPKLLQIGDYYENNSLVLWAFYNYANPGTEPMLNLGVKGSSSANWSYTTTLKPSGSGWYNVGKPVSVSVSWTNADTFFVLVNNEVFGPFKISDPITNWAGEKIYMGTSQSVSFSNAVYDEVRLSKFGKSVQELTTTYLSPEPLEIDNLTSGKMSLDNNIGIKTNTATKDLPVGRISKVLVDSSYLDGSGIVKDISSRLIINDSRIKKAYMSGNGNKLFYNNPDDSNRLWVLDLLTGNKQNVSSDKVPTLVKSNYDGTKIAFKDANNVLYFTDLLINSISTVVNQSVRDFEVSTDGTLFYLYRDENSSSEWNVKLFKYSNSSSNVLTSGLHSGSQLALSKDGRKLYYSAKASIIGDEYVNGIWASIFPVVPSVGKDIWDMWTSFDGNYLYYQATGGYYIFDVSNNTSRKINVPAYKDIIRVVNNDELLLYNRANDNYEVYYLDTDSSKLVRPEDAINYNGIDADDTGLRLAYPSSTGIKIKNLGKVTRPERYLLSFDGKNTWLSYKKGTWTEVKADISPEAADFDKYGLTIDEVNALTKADFAKLYEDGREIYNFDVAILFASTDAFTTPVLKGITVTMNPGETAVGGETIEKALYTTKTSSEFNSTNWRQIKKVYPVEIQPREAEVYYFVYSNGTYYNFTNITLSALQNQSLLGTVEANWIEITQQGLTADELRNLPTEALDTLLNKQFTIVYAMRVIDQSTDAYSSLINMDYVENQFQSTNLVLKITLNNGQVKEFALTKDQVENFMVWLNDRQHNRGPLFYRIETSSTEPGVIKVNGFVNFYDIQYVDVVEKA